MSAAVLQMGWRRACLSLHERVPAPVSLVHCRGAGGRPGIASDFIAVPPDKDHRQL